MYHIIKLSESQLQQLPLYFTQRHLFEGEVFLLIGLVYNQSLRLALVVYLSVLELPYRLNSTGC